MTTVQRFGLFFRILEGLGRPKNNKKSKKKHIMEKILQKSAKKRHWDVKKSRQGTQESEKDAKRTSKSEGAFL